MGSGVIVERNSHSYYIVTNAHVIGTAEDIQIRLNDGEMVNGRLVGKDIRKDLAVVRIKIYQKKSACSQVW